MLNLGVGRRTRPLGPLTVDIAAPREVVFDVIAAPYLGRAPRDVAERLAVVERGSDMVVAEHRTPLARGLVATTLESVRFERPHSVHFRLLQGPVPSVTERFRLDEDDGSTRLRYDGELTTDLWSVGGMWGALVARSWVAVVEHSLDDVRQRAERKATAQQARLTSR